VRHIARIEVRSHDSFRVVDSCGRGAAIGGATEALVAIHSHDGPRVVDTYGGGVLAGARAVRVEYGDRPMRSAHETAIRPRGEVISGDRARAIDAQGQGCVVQV
jgi:hypothetical protein